MNQPKKSGAKAKSSTECRVCGADITTAKEPVGPFCSARCKMQDLSKWFGENYRIASSQASMPETDDEPES